MGSTAETYLGRISEMRVSNLNAAMQVHIALRVLGFHKGVIDCCGWVVEGIAFRRG
jgi:hypothetical protein